MAKRRSNFIVRGGADFSAISKAMGGLQKKMKRFSTRLNGAFRGVRNITTGVARMTNNVRRAIPRLRLFNRETARSSRNMGMLARGMLRIAAGIFVFKQISNVMQGMINTTRNLLRQNEEWSASMNAVRVNLWTAFAPIWDAVLPALITLGNVLAAVTQKIAAFAAILGGTTFTAARDAGEALHNQAKAYDAAGSAAQEAQKQLMGFDDINRLSSSDGGGADTGGLDFSAVKPPSAAVNDWLEEFAYRLRSITPDLDYFHNLGYQLAQSVANALDNIQWGNIQQRVATWIAELASFLNGIVANSAFWNSLGNTLVEGIRTALIAANTFMETFNFFDFGVRIAEIFNRLISLLPELGTTVGKYINSIFQFLHGLFTGADWVAAGQNIAGGINNLFYTVDWAHIAQTISKGVRGFLTTILETLRTLDWQLIGESISEFLTNVDWRGIIEDVIAIIREALSGLHIVLSEIFGAEMATGIMLFTGLMVGLKVAVPIISKIIGAVRTVIAVIGKMKTIFAVVKKVVLAVIAVIKSPFILIGAAIAAVIAGIVLLIKNWEAVKAFAKEVWASIWNTIKNAGNLMLGKFRAVGDFFAGMWERMRDGARGAWQSIRDTFSVIPNWFRDTFSRAWEKVRNVFSVGGRIFDGIKEGIGSAFKTVVNTLIRGINTVIAAPFNKINNAFGRLRDVSIAGLSPFGFLPSIAVPEIPKLATGAVVPPNNEFMAILGDNKHETEIVSPLSTMKQAMSEVLAGASFGGSGDINVTFTGELAALGKILAPHITKGINNNGIQAGVSQVWG
ncbi:MAG: hypothetical protein FWB96_11815 [Defluviitaleaceae bacterium]|nr:hypothetical protein [Defluviitaleaceae bacterium]MCL2263774.1 hypothetical protein [Defluviitaleaceae bacterium]